MNLSARGSRQLGETVELIEDPAVLAQVRRQALKVNLKSAAAGLVLTAIVMLIP